VFRQFDHLGIAVQDLDRAVERVEAVLGLKAAVVEEVADQQVRAALIPMPIGRLELLQPTTPESAVARFLDRRGEGPHHVCFAVDDISSARTQISANGGELIQDAPRDGLTGIVDFVHPKTTGGVLTEIAEITLFTPASGDLQTHHVTIRTQDADAAGDRWARLFGIPLKRKAISEGFHMSTVWLDGGDAEIEFAQQLNESGPVARAIAQMGEGIHALVLESSEPEKVAEGAANSGVRVITDDGESDNVLRAIHPLDFLGTLVLIAAKQAPHAGLTSVAENSAH
jgi:methylmalonyl-CoA/ethylmalonyl-CoA epimerase